MHDDDDDDDESGSKHGGTAVGVTFIVLAIALNFLLDDMSPDEVAELPWFIALAFESRGKLGVTVVLCFIGVLFIAYDHIVNQPASDLPPASGGARSGAPGRGARSRPNRSPAPVGEAEVVAEEVPEDTAAEKPKKRAKSRGPFGGGGAKAAPRPEKPPAPPPPSGEGGAMVLSTAKYLNMGNGGGDADGESGGGGGDRDGLPDFRKGRARHTRTE